MQVLLVLKFISVRQLPVAVLKVANEASRQRLTFFYILPLCFPICSKPLFWVLITVLCTVQWTQEIESVENAVTQADVVQKSTANNKSLSALHSTLCGTLYSTKEILLKKHLNTYRFFTRNNWKKIHMCTSPLEALWCVKKSLQGVRASPWCNNYLW